MQEETPLELGGHLEVGRQSSQFEEANVKLTGQNDKRNNCLEKGRHMENFLWLMELH